MNKAQILKQVAAALRDVRRRLADSENDVAVVIECADEISERLALPMDEHLRFTEAVQS